MHHPGVNTKKTGPFFDSPDQVKHIAYDIHCLCRSINTVHTVDVFNLKQNKNDSESNII